MKNRRPILLSLLFILTSCHARAPLPDRSMWQGTVELREGVAVPFRMSLDFSADKPAGYFLTGDEKSPIPEISRDGDAIVLGFSEYGAEVRASWKGRELAGEYRRIRSSGTKSFKWSATPVDSKLEPEKVAGPEGNYQVLFRKDDSVDDATVAKLWNTDGALYGTFIAPDGDYGLLEGKRLGSAIQLSRFTGWQATAIVLEQQGDVWRGVFYAASEDRPQPFVLQARADLNVPAPESRRTVMKNPGSEFTFSGLSLSGETVRNTDERFKGKALIVDIMGTWCHNCLDEAPVLQRLQNQFGKDGLEIVGLSFEIKDDAALAKKNLQLYKDRYGLTYTLLFCGSLDDDNVKKQLHSQLDKFFAYPTAIFIDRNHRVQAIHSGFKGPGTGGEFQLQIREFEEIAGKLVH